MKTRTLLVPAAFAGTAVFAAMPDTTRAAVAEPMAVSSNVLVAELDTVVGAANSSNAVLGGEVVAIAAGAGKPATSTAACAPKVKLKNAKIITSPHFSNPTQCPQTSGPAKFYKRTTPPKLAPRGTH